MANKHALYDNPAGYGHGGLGYDLSLDTLPTGPPPPGQMPAWVPWVGLAGGGLLGVAGLRGLSKLLRRAPKAQQVAKPVEWSLANERLGRPGVDAVKKMRDEALAGLESHGVKMSAAIIPQLGRIARGE